MPSKAAFTKTPMPKSLRIGPFDYTIKRWGRRAADNTGAYGMCDKGTITILIQEGLAPQLEAEVLLHEVLHACYHVGSLREHEYRNEEAIVASLTFPLLQVIRDNPHFTDYLNGAFAGT